MTLLEACGVHKVFGGTFHALRGVDVSLARGEFVAIMGPSGCGKSSLLHLLGTLDTPSEGEVRFEGRDVSGLSDDDKATLRRKRIGFVFQFFNLVPVLTAAENVALPATIDAADRKLLGERVHMLLERVGLGDAADKLPNQLSGGEQQRVALARALVNDPDVLLLDEPTGSLDSATGTAMLELLTEVHNDARTTVLVTHDAKVAGCAGRVLLMRDGLIADEAALSPHHTEARRAKELSKLGA